MDKDSSSPAATDTHVAEHAAESSSRGCARPGAP